MSIHIERMQLRGNIVWLRQELLRLAGVNSPAVVEDLDSLSLGFLRATRDRLVSRYIKERRISL